MLSKQPRLRLGECEFFGEAKTVTGNVWWYEERQEDGSVRRIPLMSIEPEVGPPAIATNSAR